MATNRLADFLGSRFPPEQNKIYNLRNIFILPTLYTILLSAVIVLLWVLSVQFLINLGYLLVFLLIGLIILSMMQTYRTLEGLSISSGEFLPVFAGETAGLNFEILNTSSKAKGQIDLSLGEHLVSSEPLAPNERQIMVLALLCPKRGIITIPRIAVRTIMPMGFFVAWSYFQSAKKILVFPKPIFSEFPTAEDDQGDDKGKHEVPGKEEIVGIRDYQIGDSVNLLSWKTLAQRDILATKMTVQATGGKTLLFDWNQTDARADDEYRLSQLCGWVVSAHKNNDSFGIKLPSQLIPVDSGAAHLRRCLTELASY